MSEITWLTLGMAAVTYLGRISGYWFILFVKPNEKTQAFLRLVPGTIFIAMIAPQLIKSGWPGWLSGAIVFTIAAKSGNMFLALIVGVLFFLGLQWIIV